MRICKIVDCPGWPQNKTEKCEKKDKYLDLAREWKKKQWNMKVTIVPIVIGNLGVGLSKSLGDLEVGGRVDTIQTSA